MTWVLFVLVAGAAAAAPSTPVSDAVHSGHAVGHEQDGVEAVRAVLKGGGNVDERDPKG
jgi:hypothetical protein